MDPVQSTKKQIVLTMLRENWLFLAGAVLFSAAAILFSYMIPFISTFTLDYVIQGISESIPSFLIPLSERIGRVFWFRHLYLLGVILIFLTGLQGAFTYLRKICTAILSENVSLFLRQSMYRKLQSVPVDYHKHHQTGDLI